MSNDPNPNRRDGATGAVHSLLSAVEGRAQRLRHHLEEREARKHNPDGYDGSVGPCDHSFERPTPVVVESEPTALVPIEQDTDLAERPAEPDFSTIFLAELAGAVTVGTIAMLVWLFLPFANEVDPLAYEQAEPVGAQTDSFQIVASMPLCAVLSQMDDSIVCDVQQEGR